jgi:hypothetical protein
MSETEKGKAAIEKISRGAALRQWSEPMWVMLPTDGAEVLIRQPTKFFWALR